MEKFFKKFNIAFLIAIIIILLFTFYTNLSNSVHTIDVSNENTPKKIKLIIDPGHGGMDPGTIGVTGIGEAPINLEISSYLMKLLEGSGFEIEMTRYDDNGLYTEKSETVRAKKNEDLRNRVNSINNSTSDLAISIHLNSFPQSQYYGAHVFYKNKCESSKIAADILQENMKNILDKNNKRVPQIKKDIVVLDDSKIPTILIECGFLSNPTEEQKLNTPEYQKKIAWSIYTGILEYFNTI